MANEMGTFDLHWGDLAQKENPVQSQQRTL